MALSQPSSCHIAIVGGGAAGMAAAVFARRHNPERSVIVFDGAKKPGAKILVSGGGRCNVTNSAVSETDFWGGPRGVIRRVLRALPVADTITFFRDMGVRLHEEADGKLFPDTNRARDVLDAVLSEVARAGATLQAGDRVVSIDREAEGFRIGTSSGDVRAGCVVMATGGQSLPKTGSDGTGFDIARSLGHTIVPTTPGLAPLVLDGNDKLHGALTGVAHPVELSVWIDNRVALRLGGPMLWTHFGVSGPVALNASRHWLRAQLEAHPCRITASFFPGENFEAVDARLGAGAAARPKATIQSLLAATIPVSVVAALLGHFGIDPSTELAHFPRADRRRLAHGLADLPLPVVGSRGYSYAEVTAGGVPLTEIDASTLESRVCAGLYFAGEILDVDGRIGGFNFQWAWSSAFVAGRAAAMRGTPTHLARESRSSQRA